MSNKSTGYSNDDDMFSHDPPGTTDSAVVFQTPESHVFRVTDDALVLPVSISAYDAGDPIIHDRFTSYTVASTTTRPTKELITLFGVGTFLFILSLAVGTGIAGLLITVAVLCLLTGTVFLIQTIQQTSSAAVVQLSVGPHTAQFTIEGSQKEIHTLESALDDALEPTAIPSDQD